ncbi:MAG: DUF3048 domain-containing protein [Bacilli bacterium]|nr:DUF3048 domain-containing protein [Bacilli bacterium]
MKNVFNKVKELVMKNKEISILVLLVIIIGGGFAIKTIFFDKKETKNEEKVEEKKEEKEEIVEPVKKLQIIDLDSTTRPVGVMYDNVKAALPQAGLNDAYLVYEIIVEGGFTRLFALFKDSNTEMIGPVRSLRHYYIDYALENNAVLAHFGQSPKAESDLSALGINNLNGMINPGSMYWRDSKVTKAPHNAFTSMTNIRTQMEKLGYNKEVTDTLLNYSVDEIDLSLMEGAVVANNIEIPYSYSHKTTYEYDIVNKVYKRSMNGNAHVDRITGVQYTVKNIIVYNVKNYNLPDVENKGRQDLSNIGTGLGYYISNGYAVPITYEKTSRAGKTVYKYMNGEEINVNDGNTYIQIQPSNKVTVIQ